MYVYVYIFDAQHREALMILREEVHMYYIYTIRIYIYMHAYMHTYILYTYIYIIHILYVYIYIYAYIFDEIYIYTFLYIQIYICIYIYIYIILPVYAAGGSARASSGVFFLPLLHFCFCPTFFFSLCMPQAVAHELALAQARELQRSKRGGGLDARSKRQIVPLIPSGFFFCLYVFFFFTRGARGDHATYALRFSSTLVLH
jgi:hypothetical protein